MSEVFNHKIFNGEVFQKYIDRLPNTNRTELIKSRAIRQRPELASSMADQNGGNYITTPLKGLISGSVPQNYDGSTNLDSNDTYTFSHSRVVVGRMNAWNERDFSYDITSGEDFLENVAEQVSEYWDEVDQATLVHILNGIFKMSDEEGLKFVSAHTYDVSAKLNSEGTLGNMDGTTLNTCMQRACGDNKGKFSLAIMHSFVATNMENLKLLAYLKYTDKDGITRDLAIGTLNGRTVLVDDNMPVAETVVTAEVKGVHTITVNTPGVAGDKVSFGGVEYTFDSATSYENKTIAVGSSASDQAAAIKTVLATQYDGIFSITKSGAVVTLTQVVGGTGDKPAIEIPDGDTVEITAATTTVGVARVVKTVYTTYVLGDGAIEYTDCGAKVPYEMDRNPEKHGGEETLY